MHHLRLRTVPLLCCLIIAFVCVIAKPADAAYLHAVPQEVEQPDGEVLHLFATGDEYYNFLHDAEGYVILRDAGGWLVYAVKTAGELAPSRLGVGEGDPASLGVEPWLMPDQDVMRQLVEPRRELMQRGLVRSPSRDGRMARSLNNGTLNNIVVFIRFSDEAGFSTSYSAVTPEFSDMTTYYDEVSYQQLSVANSYYPAPSGDVIVSYQDANPRSYYQPYNATTNPNGYANDTQRRDREHMLLKNAIDYIDGQNMVPDGLDIDADNDNYVDSVSFVVSGSSGAWASLLWPHRWSLYSQNAYINSKRVYDYMFVLETHMDASTISHEMFHVLGAPDLYHYTNNGIDPAGPWDIMEWSWKYTHMNCFMKWKYGGWIDSIPELTTPGDYTLNPLSSSTNQCYKIASPNSATEYFVVEYRKKNGSYEDGIPGEGLLVWRIDPSAGNGNASGPPDEVYVYRPGGATNANGDVNNANFSIEEGRTQISDATDPDPFLQDGSAGGLELSNIGSAGGATMAFTLGGEPPMTLAEALDNASLDFQSSGDADWTGMSDAGAVDGDMALSGAIGNDQKSELQVSVVGPGTLSFAWKVSSELGYDYLKLEMDSELVQEISGGTNWAQVDVTIPDGVHAIEWSYEKDYMISEGEDRAYVDNVTFTSSGGSSTMNCMPIIDLLLNEEVVTE